MSTIEVLLLNYPLMSILSSLAELFIPEECISYGCEIVDSDCICIYSDICPVYIFTFPTKEDCEAVVNGEPQTHLLMQIQNS